MLGSPLPGVFRGQYDIPYVDADATGALRFTSLIKLVQSQAGDHTKSLGWDYREHFDKGIFWVLSRMSVEFRDWPTWPCKLTVDTWTRGTKAVLALRDFRFGTDEKGWCGRSSTAWVVLKDRKPQRPEPYTKIYTPMQAEDPLVAMPPALPPLDNTPEAEGLAESLARATYSVWATWEDIDMNGHVGNVNSLGWCLDRHDFAFLSAHRPAFLDVNYLAEMFCGEEFTIVIREAPPAPSGLRVFDYSVMRATDQSVTLRLRMGFRAIVGSGARS